MSQFRHASEVLDRRFVGVARLSQGPHRWLAAYWQAGCWEDRCPGVRWCAKGDILRSDNQGACKAACKATGLPMIERLLIAKDWSTYLVDCEELLVMQHILGEVKV